MIGWGVTVMTSALAAVMALVVAPAWGVTWVFLPWLGWWYVGARRLAPIAQRIAAAAPVALLLIATAAAAPWGMILMTTAMIGGVEGAERYLFPQRRRAAYGAAVVGAIATWPWQQSATAALGAVVGSLVVTHVAVKVKQWWWL